MTTFISDVLDDLKIKNQNFSTLKFILPNIRAGIFLRNEIIKKIENSIFAPEILSIEVFLEDISGLKQISNLNLILELYRSYQEIIDDELVENFDSFSKWGNILLQDFNEVDRHLVDPTKIFNYLRDIKDLEHWSKLEEKSEIIKNYVSFWNELLPIYKLYKSRLKDSKVGYQGLIYREAVENLETYMQNKPKQLHVFLGFNALTTTEEVVIQGLLHKELATIYWDIDNYFIDNSSHSSAYFIRKYKSNWRYFLNHPFQSFGNNYNRKKHIEVIGTPKNIGQAKHIGNILETIQGKDQKLSSTAIILGDETLLTPLLNSLPENIESVNITMGLPLESIPLVSLFKNLIQFQKNRSSQNIYFKDLQIILSNNLVKQLLIEKNNDLAQKILDETSENNIIYTSLEKLKSIAPEKSVQIELLFGNWRNNANNAVNNCLSLTREFSKILSKNKNDNVLNLEYTFRLNETFNQIKNLLNQFDFVRDIKSFSNVFNEVIKTEKIDIKGEPLVGLQIMGMLESRVLDFETIIISSVNEGILPSGRKGNSFIPFDVKKEYKLPTYKEKDAIYSYHFFRLLQRAKNIYIIYNTEPDPFHGSEKSRFITQLEIENLHNIKHTQVSPNVPAVCKAPFQIKKSESVINSIKELAEKGFSPSSLTSYIRNPIDFYYQKILKIKEYDDVEETIEYSTLGSVIHGVLEDFYFPLQGQFLSTEHLENLKPKIEKTIIKHFKYFYKEGDLNQGKNLIIFEIAKRYVNNFLNLEIEILKKGNQIKILEIETDDIKVKVDIPELDFPVYLKGKIDRVDEYNGVIRIIDYKTGKVDKGKVTIHDWELINTDYEKYSKSHQILAYTYLLYAKNPFKNPVEAGIISFKNLNEGFLKFAVKESIKSRNRDELIARKTLDNYLIELKKLILEICNPEIDFIEKEV